MNTLIDVVSSVLLNVLDGIVTRSNWLNSVAADLLGKMAPAATVQATHCPYGCQLIQNQCWRCGEECGRNGFTIKSYQCSNGEWCSFTSACGACAVYPC